jgi:hypothetical protein
MELSTAPGLTDSTLVSEVVSWLLTPISGAESHFISSPIAWHGRVMVLGMGVLLPPVIMVARFFKVTPSQNWPTNLDNPFWFVSHRRWGHIVGTIVAIGLVFAIAGSGALNPWDSFHVATGWIVITLVLIQIVGAWLRGSHGGPMDPFTRRRRPPDAWPGDHFSMTPRRVVFEYVHKSAGHFLLLLTLIVIPSGLIDADAPRWMPIVLGTWWLALIATSVQLQRAGRCIDTYQAIWGPDPTLPGNRRRPIGIGIIRPQQETVRHESNKQKGKTRWV